MQAFHWSVYLIIHNITISVIKTINLWASHFLIMKVHGKNRIRKTYNIREFFIENQWNFQNAHLIISFAVNFFEFKISNSKCNGFVVLIYQHSIHILFSANSWIRCQKVERKFNQIFSFNKTVRNVIFVAYDLCIDTK